MKQLLTVLLFLISIVPARASGDCTTSLGLGTVGIKLDPSLKLVQHPGWEWMSYDVLQKQSGQKLLLIFLGSNWQLPRGTYAPITAGSLKGSALLLQGKGLFSGTTVFDLPGRTADRQLVYKFDNLTKEQYDLASALIQSTCLLPKEPTR